MSRWGVLCNLVRRSTPNDLEILRRPDGANRNQAVLWEIFETGDLAGFVSRLSIPHPAMHLYTAEELRRLFAACDVLDVRPAPTLRRTRGRSRWPMRPPTRRHGQAS